VAAQTPADVLVEALRAAGIPTGDAQAKDGTTELTGRYVVVWPVQEPPPDGPLADPNADRSIELQITAAGPSRRAADQVAEQARAVALGRLVPPAGWTWRSPARHAGGQAAVRETSVDPSSPDASGWYRADIYRYEITPGGSG
jgi:hypothetical protein